MIEDADVCLVDLEKPNKLRAHLLCKNQLYANLSEIEDEDFGVSEEDKTLNRAFYSESCQTSHQGETK